MREECLLQVNLPGWGHPSEQKLSCEYYLMLSSSWANCFKAFRWLNKLPKVGVIINEINPGKILVNQSLWVQNLVGLTEISALKILGFEQVRTEGTSVELRTGPEVRFGKFSELLSEKPVGPCNVNKVNNDRATLQCITTGEKWL